MVLAQACATAARGYNRPVQRYTYYIAVAACLILVAGCPRGGSGGGVVRDALTPASAIPVNSALAKYDKLKLGMSEFELAQVYNAPEGRGDGFTRVLQRFDQVSIHTIDFDPAAGQPLRKLLLEFYRDQLCRVVDRRDGMSQNQATAWLNTCKQQYGPPTDEPVAGAQWSWGDGDSVLLSFTQDNASENSMSVNAVLVHQPTLTAAQNFLREWEAAH